MKYECGCKTVMEQVTESILAPSIEFCPMHAAAPKLLEALGSVLMNGINDETLKKAREAISSAEGRNEP